MIASLRAFAITAPIVLAGTASYGLPEYDPHTLMLVWRDHTERLPATSLATCQAAIDAIEAGRWLADDPPVAMRCAHENGFAAGEECVKGFNCGARR